MIRIERCPDRIRESLRAYVTDGQPTGSFLRAVLENDLMGAALRADSENASLLVDIVGFVFEHVPISIRGSERAVAAHLSKMEARRREEREARKAQEGEEAT